MTIHELKRQGDYERRSVIASSLIIASSKKLLLDLLYLPKQDPPKTATSETAEIYTG